MVSSAEALIVGAQAVRGKMDKVFQQAVGSIKHLTGVMNVQNMIRQRNENKK